MACTHNLQKESDYWSILEGLLQNERGMLTFREVSVRRLSFFGSVSF
jgi:hypothetical protein